jgi:fibronectin type III domain protein
MFLHKTRIWGIFFSAFLTFAGSATASDQWIVKPNGKLAAPSQLQAHATSGSEAFLTWSDNSVNEWEFHVEMRWAGSGWQDISAIPPNVTHVTVSNLSPGRTYFLRLRARNGVEWSPYSNEAAVTGFFETPPACDSTSMCLDGRYRVTATYERGTDIHGDAHTVGLSDESGLFWFFAPSNVEAIVKVLDGCGLNKHRWVFTTGLTDLRVVILVVDTHTGATATYVSSGGGTFVPVQDTAAFSCD